MFDRTLPLLVRCFGLFHLVTPPLLLWAIWRLGYDQRGWKYQTLMAWVVRTDLIISGVRNPMSTGREGTFFHEQHLVPGALYLTGYLIAVPLLVYWPTHLLLHWGVSSGKRVLRSQ